MDRAELERLDREGLVSRAQAAGIKRARVLTRPELVDELLRLDPAADPAQLKKTRGFFGRARDLLSRVVERGLHLPDAADRLRDVLAPLPQVPRPEPQAVPTVTLAEIYAAQGHKQRAIDTLRRVIQAEPEHATARALLERLEAADYVAPPRPLPPEADERPAAPEEEEAEERAAAPSPEERAAAPEPVPPTPRLEEAALAFDGAPTGAQAPRGARAPLASECIAVPLRAGASYVWWRLSADAKAALAGRAFVVRALVIEPSWDGPHQQIQDVEIDPSAGELVLRDLPDRAIVRVAVGFAESEAHARAGGSRSDESAATRFVPLAHSPALELHRPGVVVEWTVDGARPLRGDDPRAASIARAVESAATVAL